MFYCIEAVQFTFSADKNLCSIVLKQYSLHLVQTKTHVLLY